MDYTKKMLDQKAKWLAKNEMLLKNGVYIMDVQTVYIDDDVTIGEDSIIYPNVYIEKGTQIGKNTKVLPNSFLSNARIADDCVIDSSKIINSSIGKNSTVGPMSHIRENTNIVEGARIGNFVEFKNSTFDKGSKCAHLTYIGDSDIGKNVNIGCGVVTVNYDGKHKFRTTVKDGAFIGSNVNMIAPVTVGENALLAAGSTITEDVADGAMAIARSKQTNKDGLGEKYKNK